MPERSGTAGGVMAPGGAIWDGPVPAPLVAQALARLAEAGDLLHDLLAPDDAEPPARRPDEVRLLLGEALEGLARAERLLMLGLRAEPGS
jgi:hypothetical protein